MRRALVLAALVLGSAAGLGGCGGAPLKNTGKGHAGAGGGTPDAGAPDAALEPVADATVQPAPDASGVDAPVEPAADAPPVADVALDHALVPDAPAAEARDGGGDAPADLAKDAPLSDAKTWETLPPSWLAFDVTATVALTPHTGEAPAWTSFPTTVRFSLGWLPQQGRIIIDGAATAEVSTADKRTFEATGLNLNVPFPPGCNAGSVQLDRLTFSVGADGLLHGAASGSATFWMNTAVFEAPATLTLSGGPDVTPPTLAPLGGVVDPLTPLWLQASEALAPTAAVTLVGTTSGDRIPFAAQVDDSVFGLAVSTFTAPSIVLRWGEVYKVETTGAVDLAGNALALPTTATETTPAPPPFQLENGFETILGKTYGGAGVLKASPMVITGTTSVVVGNGVGFQTFTSSTTMALRLAVVPGDTVVRLKSRVVTVAGATDAAFRGLLYVGTAGGTVETQTDVLSEDVTQVSLGATGNVTMSAVQTLEIPLPPGAKSEVSFAVLAEPNVCGELPPPTLLVIDDLRVE